MKGLVEHFRAIPDEDILRSPLSPPADMPGATIWLDKHGQAYWRCTKQF